MKRAGLAPSLLSVQAGAMPAAAHLRFRGAAALLALACLAAAAAARAEPERLEQLEPEAGQWQAELASVVAAGGSEHELGLRYGIAPWLAIGGEIEGEWEEGRFDEAGFALAALLFFSEDTADSLGTGLELVAGLGETGALASLTARFIAEKQTERWWAQGNLLLRHREGESNGESGLELAWAASLQAAIAPSVWFGIEGSGQAAHLAGFAGEAQNRAQFLGPSLTFELEPERGPEIEIGAAWLARIDGPGPRSWGSFFLQIEF
ncbi:MAG: hypothetical protein ACRC1J_12615 [Sandaracinobacteroides sp.]